MSEARDEFDRLICQYPDGFGFDPDAPLPPAPKRCGAKIAAPTGLVELERLGQHLRKRHKLRHYRLDELLELRARWEEIRKALE